MTAALRLNHSVSLGKGHEVPFAGAPKREWVPMRAPQGRGGDLIGPLRGGEPARLKGPPSLKGPARLTGPP